MTRLPLLCGVLVLAAACGYGGGREEAPALAAGEELRVVGPEDGTVEFGRPFPLEVLRSWPVDAPAPSWDPHLLAPLVLEPLGAEAWSVGGREVERRRFRARAFVLDRLELPMLSLAVDSGLREGDAHEPEPLPPGPAPPPPWGRLAAGLAGLGGLVLLAAWFRGRPRRETLEAAGGPQAEPQDARSAWRRAQERLAGLRVDPEATPEAIAAWHVELAKVLRDYLEEAHGVPAPRRTTEELERAPALWAALGEVRRAPVLLVLSACDRVKFARHLPPPEESAELLRAAGQALGEEGA